MGNWDHQEQYFDRNGVPVQEGDTLFYQEAHMEKPAVHRVIKHDGALCGITIIDEHGSPVIDDPPVGLRFYQRTRANDGVLIDAVKQEAQNDRA